MSPRRSNSGEPEWLLKELKQLLEGFEKKLPNENLRPKVQALVPAVHKLRDLGSSLIPIELAESARDRILEYFKRYPRIVIQGGELMVVAGIGEWARRVRELRVEFGWKILSGNTVSEMIREGDLDPQLDGEDLMSMTRDDYVMLSIEQDLEAAYRWNLANSIRRRTQSVRDKILAFMRENVGKTVTGEELRYVAGNRTEWARRVRELRTELGWPIATKQTGRPDLDVSEYVLEADRQSFQHDRRISDPVRRDVLKQDDYSCVNCGWNHEEWSSAAPRFLELHHIKSHVEGGENVAENLQTLCNVCHDDVHKGDGG